MEAHFRLPFFHHVGQAARVVDGEADEDDVGAWVH